DRRAQRALAGGEVAGAVAGELEPSREDFQQLGRGVLPGSCGGELDREREAVEPAAQVGKLVGLLARAAEPPRDRPRSGGEQLHRVSERQWWHPVLMLAGKAKRRPAGDEQRQLRGCREQLAEERSRLVHALEAVQQQEKALPAEVMLECPRELLVGSLLNAEGVRDRGRDQCRFAERGEVDEVDTVGERVGEVVRSLEREAGLAAAPWAGEGDEADVRAAQERADLVELVSAADESRLGGGKVSARPDLGRLDPERRVLAKDRLLERSQLWA